LYHCSDESEINTISFAAVFLPKRIACIEIENTGCPLREAKGIFSLRLNIFL
jgi:hypothetical protein